MKKIINWLKNTFLEKSKDGIALKLKSIIAIPLLILLMAGISYKWFILKTIETGDLAILAPAIIALFYKKKINNPDEES